MFLLIDPFSNFMSEYRSVEMIDGAFKSILILLSSNCFDCIVILIMMLSCGGCLEDIFLSLP